MPISGASPTRPLGPCAKPVLRVEPAHTSQGESPWSWRAEAGPAAIAAASAWLFAAFAAPNQEPSAGS
eukprot:596800-Lingulodinium_polyedra.AAC.1